MHPMGGYQGKQPNSLSNAYPSPAWNVRDISCVKIMLSFPCLYCLSLSVEFTFHERRGSIWCSRLRAMGRCSVNRWWTNQWAVCLNLFSLCSRYFVVASPFHTESCKSPAWGLVILLELLYFSTNTFSDTFLLIFPGSTCVPVLRHTENQRYSNWIKRQVLVAVNTILVPGKDKSSFGHQAEAEACLLRPRDSCLPYSPNCPMILCLSIQTLKKHAVIELYLKYLIILVTSWHCYFLACELCLTSLTFFEYKIEMIRTNQETTVGGHRRPSQSCRELWAVVQILHLLGTGPSLPRQALSLSPQWPQGKFLPCSGGIVCLPHWNSSSLVIAVKSGLSVYLYTPCLS